MLPSTDSPFQQFYDLDGSPLDEGYVYIGTVDLNPETAQSPVFWDVDGTQPAVQPIRTLNGYPVRSGTPAVLYTPSIYSVTVRNKARNLVFYAPDSSEYSSKFFKFNATGSVPRPIGEKLSDILSVKDFGAVGNGVTDDTVAIQAAVTAAGAQATGGTVWFPDGQYKVTATINIATSYVSLMGSSKDSVQIVRATAFGPIFNFATGTATVLDRTGISGMQLIDNGTNNATGIAVQAENGSRFAASDLTLFGGTSGIVLKGVANVALSDIFMYMQNPAGSSVGRYGVRVMSTAIVGSPVPFGSNVQLHNVNVYGGDNVGATYANLDACLLVEAVDGLWIAGCYFGGGGAADVMISRTNAAHTCGNIFGYNNMMDICRGNGVLINGSQLCQRLVFDGVVSCANVGVAGKDGIYITGPVDNVVLRGTVDGWKGNGVHLGVTGGAVCTNISVNGGNITGNTGFGVQIEANTGTTQLIVTGNDLAGNTAGSLQDLSAATTLKYLDGNLSYNVPWVGYTPVISAQGGAITATATGRYRQIGSTVTVQVRITGVTADTGTGAVTFQLPAQPGAPVDAFALSAHDSVSNLASVSRTQTSSLTALLIKYDGTYPSAVGRTFVITGTYQVA